MSMSMDEYLKTRGIEYSAEELADARRASMEKIEAYNLAQARKALHLTQRQLASDIGVGQSRISELERGDVGKAQVDTLRRYAQGLGAELSVSLVWPDKTVRLA